MNYRNRLPCRSIVNVPHGSPLCLPWTTNCKATAKHYKHFVPVDLLGIATPFAGHKSLV
jgi:hypothetical protein